MGQILADIDHQGGPDAAREDQLKLPEPERSISFTAVRAHVQQHGIPCPPRGHPPKAAIDAWHTANN